MSKTNEAPSWAKSWMTIAEAARAIKAAGIPNHSAEVLRRLFAEGNPPFEMQKFGDRIYCAKVSVIDYIQSNGGTYQEKPTPSPQIDNSKWIPLGEAHKKLIEGGVPCVTLNAMRQQIKTNRQLPFEVLQFAGRYYVGKTELESYIARLKRIAGTL